MPGATAYVPLVTVVNLFERRVGILFEQRDSSHDEARGAEATLCCALINICLLHGMETAIGARDAFDGGDVGAVYALHLHDAGTHRLAIHDHHATAAMASGATVFRARQPQIIAKHVHQHGLRRDARLDLPAVHCQCKNSFLTHRKYPYPKISLLRASRTT